MDFRLLTLNDKHLIEKYSLGNLGWENSFACIWAWNVSNKHKIYVDDDFVVLLTQYGDKVMFTAPYCSNDDAFLRGIDKIEQYCAENGLKFRVTNVSKKQVDLLNSDKYEISTNRNSYDYVYKTTDLVGLEGKKYHSKRNFIKRFGQNDFIFRDYYPSDYNGVANLFDTWAEGRDFDDISMERAAFFRSLDSYKETGLQLAIIEMGGQIVGFTAGEVVGNVGHTLFEKANTVYDGIYPTINNLFARHYYAQTEYINRQEDMGIEGLRKAKLSYHPLILLEKYSITKK